MVKVLTLNFLCCSVKACKGNAAAFPLKPKDAELVSDEIEINALLLTNLLPRLDWNALIATSSEVSNSMLSFMIYIDKAPSLDSLPSQHNRQLKKSYKETRRCLKSCTRF